MSNITFSTWKKPGSDEVRVYVNCGFDGKVFVVDGGKTGNYSKDYPEIKIQSQYGVSNSEKDRIIDKVSFFLSEKLGRMAMFSDFVEASK